MKSPHRARFLISLPLLLGIAALAIAGCDVVDSGGGGGNKYKDDRSDAELKEVADQALTDAKAADSGYNSLTAVDSASGETVGSAVETVASSKATTAAASAAVSLPPTASEIRANLDGPVAELHGLALDAGLGSGARAATVAASGDCTFGGTWSASGDYQSSGDDSNGTFKYKVTVDLNGCDEGTFTYYGEVVYAGTYKVKSNSDGSGSLDTDITVNGGIAMDDGTNFYNFIIRDQLILLLEFDAEGNGFWTLDLFLRVDDFTTNVECTLSGTLTPSEYSVSDFTCSSSASTLALWAP